MGVATAAPTGGFGIGPRRGEHGHELFRFRFTALGTIYPRTILATAGQGLKLVIAFPAFKFINRHNGFPSNKIDDPMHSIQNKYRDQWSIMEKHY